jgi:aspartate carbamoyltransferase catalytic subunit
LLSARKARSACLHCGTESAPHRLLQSTSSAAKGETLHDTIRCLECYADAIVLRHPQKGSAAIASAAASIPLLNAGDGVGEHPTQALLDLFTITAELGAEVLFQPGAAPLTVTLLGDLKNGRTVHSLARLLSLFPHVRLNYVAPGACGG